MPPEQPRTYKYQLTADEFIFAFTAMPEQFAERAEEMRGKGVERLTVKEIKEKCGDNVINANKEVVFTLIAETEIIAQLNESIMFRDIQAPTLSLVLWRSKAPSITLSLCMLAKFEDGQIHDGATYFHFFGSRLGDFLIEQSTTGNFSIRQQSTTGNFLIEGSTTGNFLIELSTTRNFDIKRSMTGNFDIGQSKTGGFSIRQQGRIGYFSIGGSELGDFLIEQSTTGNFSIQHRSKISGFSIDQSTTGDFDIGQESTIGYFSIGQGTTGGFSIRQQSTTGKFSIRQQSRLGNFLIEQSTTGNFLIEQSTTGYFDISQSTTDYFDISQSTTGYVYISKQSTTGDFVIRGQSTTGDFIIRGQSTTGDFIIQEKSTTDDFNISGQSTTGDFNISGQSTTGNFAIEQSTTGNFTIYNSEVAVFSAGGLFSSFNLTKATIAQFRLQNCNLPQLRIASGCRMECYIAHSVINLIDLQHLTLGKESVISLLDCTVYACLMEEFAVLGSLFFRQIKKADGLFTWYDPVAKSEDHSLRLAMLQIHTGEYHSHKERLAKKLGIHETTFRIAQSSLGKTEFTNCDLSGFRFEFNNAKITEVFMSGGTVPEENIFIHGETEASLAWHEQKVSVYNQLKKIFDGQGDIYWATHFQAKTAEHQQRVLKIRRQHENERFSTTFWDLWTFRLNQWSNLHGENWGRAILFTLGIAALFYVLFLLSLGRLFQPTTFDWNLVGQYFQFLDPTHKVDFVKDAALNVGSYVADYTGRVFIGYGIFQFISAFRKHGKK